MGRHDVFSDLFIVTKEQVTGEFLFVMRVLPCICSRVCKAVNEMRINQCPPFLDMIPSNFLFFWAEIFTFCKRSVLPLNCLCSMRARRCPFGATFVFENGLHFWCTVCFWFNSKWRLFHIWESERAWALCSLWMNLNETKKKSLWVTRTIFCIECKPFFFWVFIYWTPCIMLCCFAPFPNECSHMIACQYPHLRHRPPRSRGRLCPF